jgi:glycosyltransferase involved in cell wall biosynthesis
MPCLNEEDTIAACIKKAQAFLNNQLIDGEILISDNGSNDNSVSIAEKLGARVITVPQTGYGNALVSGCNNALGKYVIMGDADNSYDFSEVMPFLEKLREGYDLVMGDRFAGGIENGAMPWTHQYLGNPLLSYLGRKLFNSSVRDFHCGLRGYNRKSILDLRLHASGMEYATEMVVAAELKGLMICNVPVRLRKDGRVNCRSHLRTVRDGCRHMSYMISTIIKNNLKLNIPAGCEHLDKRNSKE